MNTLDEYVFVICVRISEYILTFALSFSTYKDILDRKTKNQTFYIDIKLVELQDVLRKVLQDVDSISLIENKPTI